MVVFHTSGYPQVRAPLLITLRSTSVHLLRKPGGIDDDCQFIALTKFTLMTCLEDYLYLTASFQEKYQHQKINWTKGVQRGYGRR